MAGSFSDYAENYLLDYLLEANTLLALFTSDPGEASGGAECAYTGYARKACVAGDWNAASGGSKANGNALVFPACTAGSEVASHFVIYDSGGTNRLVHGSLNATLAISAGITPNVGVGALTVSLD